MKNAIKLNYINDLKEKLDAENNLLQVLLGPRQVGKTTSVLKMISDHYSRNSHYVSADEVFNSNEEWLLEQWNYAQNNKKILFVDEIQKVENWAAVLKKLYDESKRKHQSVRCVLLGSSSLEIQKGLTESLTGRFQLTIAVGESVTNQSLSDKPISLIYWTDHLGEHSYYTTELEFPYKKAADQKE